MDNRTILVVEDESVIAMDIESKLLGLGYGNIVIADCSDAVMAVIKDKPPDLIIMDVVLKGEDDGITIAARVHEMVDVPIIYLTAYSDDETISRAKITEPYGYIIKPLRERELSVAIEIALYKHHIDNELSKKQMELEELNRTLELKVEERTRELSKEIEERKHLEQVLRQSEEMFRDMADLMPVVLVETDEKLRIVYLNKAGFEIMGYTPEDLTQNVTLWDVINPKDHERSLLKLKNIISGSEGELNEYSVRKKDGAFMNFLVKGNPIFRNGKMSGTRFVLIDIKPFFLNAIMPDKKFFEEYSFTQREQDILILLARGLKNKEIAEKLFISDNTIKTHMSNIYDKMGVSNKDDILNAIKEFQVKYVGRDKLFMSILSMLMHE